MTVTINVTLLRRHNLGNYEHVEGSITVGAAVEDGQDVAEAAARLQQQIIPLLSVDALTKAQAKASKTPKAATAKVTAPAEATPEEEAVRKVVAEAPPAEEPKPSGSSISVADARKAIQQACITDPAKSGQLVALLHEAGLTRFKDLPDARVPEFYRLLVVEQG